MITKLIRKPPWFKVWSAITAIALTIALVLTFLPYEVSIDTGGLLSISLGQRASAQEPVSTNGMAYAEINKSGCVVRKGNCQIRLDFYLESEDVRYHDTYIETVDTTSAEYLAGYPGKVDKQGNPVDQEDYDHWWDSLPKEWVNTPFHSHFVYLPATFTEADIKAQIDIHLGNFYKAFQDRWDEVQGGMRHGWATETRKRPTDYSKTEDASAYDARVSVCQAAIDSLTEFQYKPEGEIKGQSYPSTDIDIGPGATVRTGNLALNSYTYITLGNPANDTGTIDYFEIYTGDALVAVKLGTFYGSGTTWTNRDYETLGDVVGTPDTFSGLDCDVSTNDVLGIYGTGTPGDLRQSSTGGSGRLYKAGDQFGTGEQTGYTLSANYDLSLYGTGETAGAVAPTVTTQAGSAIHCSNFTANGNITDTGGENCTTRGFCYMVGQAGDPTTSNSTAYDTGSYEAGTYNKSITSLTPSTYYRVRAYAINTAGTGYGTSVTVTTGEPGISSEPDEYDFGTVAVAGTAVTGLDYFTITNTGNCTVDVTIQGTDATNMTGGTLYEYYDTGDDSVYGFYGAFWRAQTFTTASGAHSIGSVSLKLYRVGSPGTIDVSIRAVDGSSHPTGEDLCSDTTDGDTLTADSAGEWRTIAFTTTYSLSSSTMYAIVARATEGNGSNQVYWKRDATSPTYTGGALEASTDSGSSWGTTSGSDYMFREYSVYTWTLSGTATPGENIYGLKAGPDGGDYTTVVNATANSFVTDLAEDATQDWGLKIYMPTALTGYDNQEMAATITLVASEAS